MSVIELVNLRIRPEVGEADFLTAAEAANGFLKTCPGFVRRRLARHEDGSWIDCVEWASMDAALKAADLFNGREETRAFNAAIAPGSVTMRHFNVLCATG